MESSRLSEIEQDMAVMKAIVPPLMDKIEKSTEATIQLTHEIKNLVESNKKAEVAIDDHDKRIYSLEAKDLVRKSSDDTMTIIKRGVILAIVAAILSLIFVKG